MRDVLGVRAQNVRIRTRTDIVSEMCLQESPHTSSITLDTADWKIGSSEIVGGTRGALGLPIRAFERSGTRQGRRGTGAPLYLVWTVQHT